MKSVLAIVVTVLSSTLSTGEGLHQLRAIPTYRSAYIIPVPRPILQPYGAQGAINYGHPRYNDQQQPGLRSSVYIHRQQLQPVSQNGRVPLPPIPRTRSDRYGGEQREQNAYAGASPHGYEANDGIEAYPGRSHNTGYYDNRPIGHYVPSRTANDRIHVSVVEVEPDKAEPKHQDGNNAQGQNHQVQVEKYDPIIFPQGYNPHNQQAYSPPHQQAYSPPHHQAYSPTPHQAYSPPDESTGHSTTEKPAEDLSNKYHYTGVAHRSLAPQPVPYNGGYDDGFGTPVQVKSPRQLVLNEGLSKVIYIPVKLLSLKPVHHHIKPEHRNIYNPVVSLAYEPILSTEYKNTVVAGRNTGSTYGSSLEVPKER